MHDNYDKNDPNTTDNNSMDIVSETTEDQADGVYAVITRKNGSQTRIRVKPKAGGGSNNSEDEEKEAQESITKTLRDQLEEQLAKASPVAGRPTELTLRVNGSNEFMQKMRELVYTAGQHLLQENHELDSLKVYLDKSTVPMPDYEQLDVERDETQSSRRFANPFDTRTPKPTSQT